MKKQPTEEQKLLALARRVAADHSNIDPTVALHNLQFEARAAIAELNAAAIQDAADSGRECLAELAA